MVVSIDAARGEVILVPDAPHAHGPGTELSRRTAVWRVHTGK